MARWPNDAVFLPPEPGFQAAEKPFVPDYGQHGTEGENLDQQFRLHILIIIDEAFIGVLIYFCGIFFVVGKMQHGPFQGIAPVDDAQRYRFFIVGIPDQRIQVNSGGKRSPHRADTPDPGKVQEFQLHSAVFGGFQSQQAELVIFYGIFQPGRDIHVVNAVRARRNVVDIHKLLAFLCLEQCPEAMAVAFLLPGIAVRKTVVVIELLRAPERRDRGEHVTQGFQLVLIQE